MGFTEPELFESDDALIAELLRQSGTGLDFAALAKAGTVFIAPDPVIPFADGRFATPSGRIEIASDAFEEAGHAARAAALGGCPPRQWQTAAAFARVALADEQQLR